jgi:hypothetical protein
MHAAIRNNDLATVQSYLLNNPNPSTDLINIPDQMSRTPLHLAAWLGSTSMVQYLLSMKASFLLKAKDNFLPLHFAIMSSSSECCELLLNVIPTLQQRTKIVNMKVTKSLKTALHLAASKGNYKMIKLLLDSGADPCALTKDGKTVMDFLKDEREQEEDEQKIDGERKGAEERKGESREEVKEERRRSYEMIYELLKEAMETKIQSNLKKIQKRKCEETHESSREGVVSQVEEDRVVVEGAQESQGSGAVAVGPPESFAGPGPGPKPSPVEPGLGLGVSGEGNKIIKIDLRKRKKSRVGIHLSHLELEDEEAHTDS